MQSQGGVGEICQGSHVSLPSGPWAQHHILIPSKDRKVGGHAGSRHTSEHNSHPPVASVVASWGVPVGVRGLGVDGGVGGGAFQARAQQLPSL